MPIYEYLCPDCRETFDMKRSIDVRDETTPCPNCQGLSSSRVISLFSAVAKGANGSRAIAGGSSCAGCTPSPSGCAGCSIG